MRGTEGDVRLFWAVYGCWPAEPRLSEYDEADRLHLSNMTLGVRQMEAKRQPERGRRARREMKERRSRPCGRGAEETECTGAM